MDATFRTMSEIAGLRSQVEIYLMSTLSEIHKENPDLDRAFDSGDKAMAALETLRIAQASLDRKVVNILGELAHATHDGRA